MNKTHKNIPLIISVLVLVLVIIRAFARTQYEGEPWFQLLALLIMGLLVTNGIISCLQHPHWANYIILIILSIGLVYLIIYGHYDIAISIILGIILGYFLGKWISNSNNKY